MRKRTVVISGQVSGSIAWANTSGRPEIGVYLRSREYNLRVVLSGPKVRELLTSTTPPKKGDIVVANGEMFSRLRPGDREELESEVVIRAAQIVVEPDPNPGPYKTSLYGAIRGIVMFWDDPRLLIKTFLTVQGRNSFVQVPCNVSISNWLKRLPSDESRKKALSLMKSGREFTACCLVTASPFRDRKGEAKSALNLIPLEFSLHR